MDNKNKIKELKEKQESFKRELEMLQISFNDLIMKQYDLINQGEQK